MKRPSMFVSLGAVALVVAWAGSSAAQSTTSGVPSVVRSHEQAVAEAAAWSDAADEILAAREQASGRKFGPALRARLRSEMSGASLVDLESFKTAGATGRLPQGVSVPKVLGSASSDLLFTPVAPCRIVNTVATATPLAANTSRNFYVNGNAAAVFEAQGGVAGGCGIPDSATAVEMNFIAVGPAGAGDLRAFPFGSSVPNASVINYANLPGLNIANGIAQPVCDASATTCSFDLIVQADVSATHVIVDVVGYYRKFPKPVDVRTTFLFGNIPAVAIPAATVTLASLTFTPAASGTALLSSRGYCNHTQLTTTYSEIQIAAGINVTAAYDAPNYFGWGILRLPANPTGGLFQDNWTSETTLAVTAGTATTVSLFGKHGSDGTQVDSCSGSFTVRQILQ